MKGPRPLHTVYRCSPGLILRRYLHDNDNNRPTNTAETPLYPPSDHRQLAIEQELYTNSIYSPGSPLFSPNGARMFNKLTDFLRAQYTHFGFQEVITPTIYKKSLWEKSGHWENYKDDMYAVTGRGATGQQEGKEINEDEEYGLKPMNCPGHCLLYQSKKRSYKELPVRYADFSPLHRNEPSGSLSGLTRVRCFHQDDGHIFCRPSQVGEEISSTLEFVRMVYQTLRLGPYRLTLSTRPKDCFIGTIEEWDAAEAALKMSLDESGQAWTINEGDGAFYGPKIDIILEDSDGKEHQTATIQLDFQLPRRFELQYQSPAPEVEGKGESTTDPALLDKTGPVTPVLIHRAVLGSVERLMALLIEHYKGKYPFWLNPRQVIILTVVDDKPVVEFAESVLGHLKPGQPKSTIRTLPHEDNGIEVPTPDGLPWALPSHQVQFAIELDKRPISLQKKILEAKQKRYSVIIVIGRNNVARQDVNVDLSGVPDPYGLVNISASELFNKGSTRKEEHVILTPQQLRDVVFTKSRLLMLLRWMDRQYM